MTATFTDALLAADRPVIMEVKRRDGHGRDLMGRRSVADVVASYLAADAPCVSVVTGRWFGGTPELLAAVAQRSSVPVLWKDFVTGSRHLDHAAHHGASAVLLTVGLLPTSALGKLVNGCLARELTPFVEVASAEECAQVPHPAECVIAVNNKSIAGRERDTGDLDRSLQLLPTVMATGTPAAVSASGIDHPAAAARLLDAGFRGLLVGGALLRSESPQSWVTELDRHRGGAR